MAARTYGGGTPPAPREKGAPHRFNPHTFTYARGGPNLPDFLPISTPDHLANALRRLGLTPEKGLHASNRQLLDHLRRLPEFDGVHPVQIMHFLYDNGFDKGPFAFGNGANLAAAIEAFRRPPPPDPRRYPLPPMAGVVRGPRVGWAGPKNIARRLGMVARSSGGLIARQNIRTRSRPWR